MGETKIEWTHQRNPDGTVTPGYTFNRAVCRRSRTADFVC